MADDDQTLGKIGNAKPLNLKEFFCISWLARFLLIAMATTFGFGRKQT
ncbi:MAG: hypothetical protein WBC08_14895 [Rhodoferax sp.]